MLSINRLNIDSTNGNLYVCRETLYIYLYEKWSRKALAGKRVLWLEAESRTATEEVRSCLPYTLMDENVFVIIRKSMHVRNE